MNNRTKFYCWLIGKLERRRMTLQEIVDEWEMAASNADHTELSVRTFHRYRDEIDSIFGIEIKCDKTNGYRYYIWRDKYGGTDVTEWMLSALRIASLGDMLKYHNKVMLEEAPMNSHYLDDILEAIDKRYILRFHYRTGYGVEKDMTMLPAFVRLFHQRWYVIGNLWDETKSDSQQVFTPRTLPFNRIETMDIALQKAATAARHQEPTDTRQLLRGVLRHHATRGNPREEDCRQGVLSRKQLHHGGAAP